MLGLIVGTFARQCYRSHNRKLLLKVLILARL